MSLKKRILKAGAGLALAGAITAVHNSGEEVEASSWQPNTVSEIQSVIESQTNSQDGTVEYTFQWGDTLWGISEATGISLDKLTQVNDIENSSMISVGSSIFLSGDGSVLSVEDENEEVSSYDVSEEVVTETETPEEVEVQAEEDTQDVEPAPVQDTVEEETVEESAEEETVEEPAEEETVEEPVEEETVEEPAEEETVEEPAEEETVEEPAAEETVEEPAAEETTEEDNNDGYETDAYSTNNQNEDNTDDYVSEDNNLGTPSGNNEDTGSVGVASSSALSAGQSVIGSPYLWAGTTPSGFDCSGFVQWAFAQTGQSIPRTTGAQYAAATPVSNPQPGDLVFFGSGSVTHVGIYAGGGQFLGSQSSTGVAYASVHSGYWGQRFIGYGRI